MTTFNDILNDAPGALEEYITLPSYDGRILVYQGMLSLKADRTITIRGSVFYSFSEKIELLFEGTSSAILLDSFGKKLEFFAGDSYLGTAIIVTLSGDNVTGLVIEFSSKEPENCNRWRWCYLNGPRVLGEIIRRERTLSKDRLVFQDGNFEIIFENRANYNRQQKRHREISHYCELRNINDTPVSKETALREIRLFSRFFSFVAGCLHAPFFIEGLDGEVKSCIHSIPSDSSLVSVSSWKPDYKDSDLVPLWSAYRAYSNESVDKADVLNTAIHWYLQANMNSGMLEGALLLGFTGIELISNEVVGRELSNEKIIEDFIQRLNLELDITPNQIAQTRNYLMHYKNEYRRTTYNSLSFEEKVSRLDAVLHILELTILYLLGYKGHYNDRLHMQWRGDSTKIVPWAQTKRLNNSIY